MLHLPSQSRLPSVCQTCPVEPCYTCPQPCYTCPLNQANPQSVSRVELNHVTPALSTTSALSLSVGGVEPCYTRPSQPRLPSVCQSGPVEPCYTCPLNHVSPQSVSGVELNHVTPDPLKHVCPPTAKLLSVVTIAIFIFRVH